MRCQRCGFEIEPGQTFCSMCGTEQSKAMREPKKKIKSILGVIKVADYIIDLGPEGGDNGGEIIATTTPEELVKIKKSYTGLYLKNVLKKNN